MEIVSIALDEIKSPDDKETWFEVYAVLKDGSIHPDYDEIVPDLETAVKVVRGFVDACFR